jgi:hypothetical protein
MQPAAGTPLAGNGMIPLRASAFGTTLMLLCDSRCRRLSKFAKKNSLSVFTGPPTVPPY